MAETNARDAKLIQYLNEAYGTERRLETALQAHITMTTRKSYKKRLEDHLRETKRHAKDVQRRVKQLGGTVETVSLPGPDAASDAVQAVQTVAQKAAAAAQGPLHMLRGTGEQEKLLRNARTEYQSEAEEIATYTAIAQLADTVGDRETAKLARSILREEQRMAKFLERLIPTLTKSVATAEIPASERRGANGGRTRRRASGARRSSSSRRTSGSSSRSRGRTRAASGGAGRKASRSGGSSRARSGSRSSGSRRSSS